MENVQKIEFTQPLDLGLGPTMKFDEWVPRIEQVAFLGFGDEGEALFRCRNLLVTVEPACVAAVTRRIENETKSKKG